MSKYKLVIEIQFTRDFGPLTSVLIAQTLFPGKQKEILKIQAIFKLLIAQDI